MDYRALKRALFACAVIIPLAASVAPHALVGAVPVPNDGPYAWITSDASGVEEVALGSNTVVAQVASEEEDWQPILSPNGTQLFVSQLEGYVQVIDTATATVAATITVGSDPYYMALSPDGSTLYVANYGDSDVSVIDTATDTVTGTLSTGVDGPFGIALSPDGNTLYVPNYDGDSLAVFNLADGDAETTVTSADFSDPSEPTVSPDGSTLYVPNRDSSTVTVLDTADIGTATNPVVENLDLSSEDTYSFDDGPNGVTLVPGTDTAYVEAPGNPYLASFNTSTYALGTEIDYGGSDNYGLDALNANDTALYLPSYGDDLPLIGLSSGTASTMTFGGSGYGSIIGIAMVPPGTLTDASLTASSSTGGASGASYTLDLTTATETDLGEITATLPAGTSGSSLTVESESGIGAGAATLSAGTLTYTVTSPEDVAAGTAVSVTIGGLTNAAAGSYPETLTTEDANAAPDEVDTASVTLDLTSTATVTLSVNPSSPAAGSSVTLTAAVDPADAAPTGTVTFYDHGDELGTSALSPVNGTTSDATWTIADLSSGTHVFTATFNGDATLTSATSAAVTIAAAVPVPSTGAGLSTLTEELLSLVLVLFGLGVIFRRRSAFP